MALPSYAGTRAGTWDDTWATYNLSASSTTGIRAAIANAGTARVRLLGIGHSEMAGEGSSIGTTDMPVQLRKRLAAAGVPVGGTGIVYLTNADVRDSRWAVGSGFADDGTFLNQFYDSTASGGNATFTSDVAGTVVDVSTYGISGPFTVTIDGGTARAVTPNGQNSVQVVSFTGLAATTHTVKVTATSAATVYLIGAGVRGTTGLEITNAGYSGTTAANWSPKVFNDPTSDWYNPYNTALGSSAGPSLAMVQLDANEALQGIGSATYKTNMQTLLTALRTAAIPFLLVASPSMVPGGSGYAAVSQASWNALLSAEYDLADQYNVPLIDVSAKFGTWSAANAAGYMFDQVHPTGAGYDQIASLVAHTLTYTGAATPGAVTGATATGTGFAPAGTASAGAPPVSAAVAGATATATGKANAGAASYPSFSLTATPEPDAVPPRVRLDVVDTRPTPVTSVTITRQDASGRSYAVRTSDGGSLQLSAGRATVYDYETPLGTDVVYTTNVAGGPTANARLDSDRIWLVHPGVPSRSFPVAHFRRGSFTSETWGLDQGVFAVLGRDKPIVVTGGARTAPAGSFTLGLSTAAELAALRALLSDGAPLMLNSPANGALGIDTGYIAVGDVTVARTTQILQYGERDVELKYQVVDRPEGGTQGGITWDTVVSEYATWAAETAAVASWSDLANPTT